MKIKKFLLIVFLLSGVVLSSCKKDDDKIKIVTDDPRIRTMGISALPATFVVNDMEGLIFNYDSLSYGTVINKLFPEFAGYGGKLSFQYKLSENGEWKEFSNTDTLDFSSLVFFKSIAPDSSYTKEYTVDIRVHKYDVEAFTWTKNEKTLPVQGTVVSQKAIFYNQKYYFFYSNEAGKSYVITSENGDDWKEAGEIDIDGPDWTTLTSMHQSHILAVQAAEELYVCDLSAGNLSFTQLVDAALPEGVTLQVPLFTLGNNFWIIAKEEDLTYYLYSLAKDAQEYQKGVLLPSGTPVEQITACVFPSGSTILGYIFGGKNANGNGTIWGIDIDGNIMELTSNQSALPSLSYSIPLFFGNKLYVTGGMISGNYSDQFYASPNSGAAWSKDNHKVLPLQVSKGSIFEYKRNNIILIGGENKSGFSPSVWKGELNQEILDDIILNGK
jgi:hypothetical protein